MNNECMSKHPNKAWFCELPAFHRGDHRTYTGWGSTIKAHDWPRTNRENGSETMTENEREEKP